MGLIQAASGAIGGMLADQWKDFYTIPTGLPGTAAVFAAVPQGTNAGRGSNTKGSSNIITNGTKIVVPEGYGLLLFQDGDRVRGWRPERGSLTLFAGSRSPILSLVTPAARTPRLAVLGVMQDL